MCFSSGAQAPINPAPYSLDNSQSAVTETITDAPPDPSKSPVASTPSTADTKATPSTAASGLKQPGLSM